MSKNARALLPFLGALVGLSMVSILFYLAGAWRNQSWDDWYLVWNLGLGWLPLLFTGWLYIVLRRHAWSSWQGLIPTVFWLAFLPNSFYMVSDYIHLRDIPRVDIIYDAVMFTLFIMTSLLTGLTSVCLVHMQLRRRLNAWRALTWIGGVLLVASFAIYLGRDLRWNTWDIVLNPAGLLFDVSDRVVAPWSHPEAYTITGTFFAFLLAVYSTAWATVQSLRRLTVR